MNTDKIWQTLDQIKDPEIPVVSLVEMGIIRDVQYDGDHAIVTMTPTFSGCPALHVMCQDIEIHLQAMGIPQVTVETVMSPPWTSDWITDEARLKLKSFGLAPPPKHGGAISITFFDHVTCPRCDSPNTILTNSFGTTLCRTMYVCSDCKEPFEQFKPL